MTDKDKWPQWLKDADTAYARVEITDGGRVIWHSGEWRDGIWHDGEWHDGLWRNGEWHDGLWRNGEWHDGLWLGGMWLGGTWLGGIWHIGAWRGGEWRGGATAPTRAAYTPLIHADGDIAFGCQKRSRKQWEKVIAGDLECADAPARDTEAWRLLVAAYRAACAYADALEGPGA